MAINHLTNFKTRTRTTIQDEDGITSSSSKHVSMHNIQTAFTDAIKKNPEQLESIQNTFLLAIKTVQESVNHGGESYFTNSTHYGAISEPLLKTLLTQHKSQLEHIAVHRHGLGNTKRNFSSLFHPINRNHTNYTKHAVELREFIQQYSYATRDNYTGTFVNDKREGQGTYTSPNGITYTGTFVNDKREGRGTYTSPNGITYIGTFVNDKREGQGTIRYPDGITYIGTFVNDKREGQGTIRYPDGAKYEGQWQNNKANGQGTYTFPSGKTFDGITTNNRNNDIEQAIIGNIFKLPQELSVSQIQSFCKNMLPGYNNALSDIMFHNNISNLQSFYNTNIRPNLIKLSDVTNHKLTDSITQENISPDSMVLVLNNTDIKSKDITKIEIFTNNYFINAMVSSLITRITNNDPNAVVLSNHTASPLNRKQILPRIIAPDKVKTLKMITLENISS